MPGWIKIIISLIAMLILLNVFGSAFRTFTVFFLVFWLLLPIIALSARNPYVFSLFSYSGIRFVRGLLAGLAVLISFALFANYEHFRDRIGERFIKGYRVSYYTDTDDFGRLIRESDVHTRSASSQFLLWVSEWVLLVFCVGNPVVTWKAGSKMIDAWDRNNHKDIET